MYEFNPHELEPFWESWYIEEKIGEGSFGYVYKIYKEEFGVKYYSALKIIPVPGKNTTDKELQYATAKANQTKEYTQEILASIHQEIEAIRHEIQIMSELKGRTNIVSFEDNKVIAMEDGIRHFVLIRMELLENLRDYQIENPLNIEQTVDMGKDLCRALMLCHKKSIIHRDIKIDNIFVTEDGVFKLGDFGIAKQLIGLDENLSVKGTHAYMAPEIILRKPYDNRVDIYSLGMVLYYYVNNRKGPFLDHSININGHGEKELANNKRFKGEKIPKPILASERFSEILLKSIEFDSKDRYQSAEEFLEALENMTKDDMLEQEHIDANIFLTLDDEKLHLSNDDATYFLKEEVELTPKLYDEKINSEPSDQGNDNTKDNGLDGLPGKNPTDKRKKIIYAISSIGAVFLILIVWKLAYNPSKPNTGEVAIQQTPTIEPTIEPTSVPEQNVTLTPTPTEVPVILDYEMDVGEMGISDYTAIDDIESLTSLSAAYNELESILPLKNSIHLNYLNLQENKIKSLEGIEKLTKLLFLNISNNKINSIERLKGLVGLEGLQLSDNSISDLKSLEGLVNLKVLYLDDNQELKDIESLVNLTQLETLILSNTKITDISPLLRLSNLKMLDLTGVDIPDKEIERIKERLPQCEIWH